jgi:hypothetical protein
VWHAAEATDGCVHGSVDRQAHLGRHDGCPSRVVRSKAPGAGTV